ncbi:MAG: hypothetical protein ACRDXC_12600 [Acidimicrobiales bacterium]
MLIVEIVAGVLVVALAVVMAVCGVVGLLGIIGAVRIVRCSHCRRIALSTASAPLRSCSRCRHGWLLHPLYQMQHAHRGSPRLESAVGPTRPDGCAGAVRSFRSPRGHH